MTRKHGEVPFGSAARSLPGYCPVIARLLPGYCPVIEGIMHITPLRTSPGPVIVAVMLRNVILAAALFLAGAVAFPGVVTAAPPDLPSNRAILENFNIIAFGNEYTGRRYETVRKLAPAHPGRHRRERPEIF
jgi:hypothetical protein